MDQLFDSQLLCLNQEKKVREQQEAKSLEAEVTRRVSEQLQVEAIKREKAARERREEDERRAAEQKRAEDGFRLALEQQKAVERSRIVAEEARRRENDRRKMGMTPTVVTPEPQISPGLSSSRSPDILLAQTPTASAGSQALPTPIRAHFPPSSTPTSSIAPRAQGMGEYFTCSGTS